MKTIKEEVDAIIHGPGFAIIHCGMRYKFGSHNFVYRWSDSSAAWIKSDVVPETLTNPITTRIIRERAKLNESPN